LQAGAPVNIGLPETPLIAAATAGLTDFVKCLVQAGADANIPDDVSFILTLSFIVTFDELICCL
jgi:hypothetical protein